ncbi:hypothetical protein Bca4012_011172 [Brassica carinata]|uniref:NYN domain-containing protein n=1 Tax=Brassica carinata TaxID=52824 RepID=A0A8X7V172_BRACI|nr:hypothetical protein Bca52824_035992 [Brassica carinata]
MEVLWLSFGTDVLISFSLWNILNHSFLFFQENHTKCLLTCPPSCKNQKTIFYWDAENAPIPYEMERDDLLKMFRSSLIRFGYNGVFEIKVFVGGYRQNHRNSRMSLQDKETMEKHGIPLFYAESEEDDAADFALLRVLKQDDRHSNYKNNVVIIGGDHRHVKHLQFCQDRHKRNVMLLYTQALKRSLENVLKKQLSLRDFLELPAPSKEDKQQYDRAKRIASGQMDPYRDGQRAKKWRKEQRRKARNAEELQALGINEYVVLNEEKLVKENPKKNKNTKANKGFNEEKKHKMEENEEEGEL